MSTFPITIPVSNQATYTLSKQQFSDLVHCSPEIKGYLFSAVYEHMRSLIQSAFKNIEASKLSTEECAFYQIFSDLVSLVANPSTDQLEAANQSYNLGQTEDRFFMLGVVCDQKNQKTCYVVKSYVPSFLYAQNKFFKQYQELKAQGKINPFKGDFEKDTEEANLFLNNVYEQVKDADMQSLFEAFGRENVVVEDFGNGMKNIRGKRDDENFTLERR